MKYDYTSTGNEYTNHVHGSPLKTFAKNTFAKWIIIAPIACFEVS